MTDDHRPAGLVRLRVMRVLFVAAALLAFRTLGAFAATPTETPSGATVSGLVGYWPLDENGGTVAHDQSGNGNDGAISGCAWTAGVVGSALACNGGHVVVPDSPSLSPTGAVSVAVWIKTSVAQPGIGLVTKGPATYDYDYMLYLSSAGVAFFIQGTVGTTDATGANFTYADNQWHHLVGVYDGTELRLYIDGSPVAAKTSSVGALRDSGNALRMAEGWSGPFNGSIDAVRVYNNGLSDAQVAAVFQADGGGPAVPTNTVAATSTPPPGATVTASATSTATATPISAASTSTPTLSPTDTPMPTPTQSGGVSGPAGYWPLDENGGTVAHDQSGNGNDGAISGCAWTAGVVGSALACNGGHVVVPNSPSLSPTGAVSVAVWIKTSVAQPGIGLVTKGPATYDYDYMLYLGSGGVAFFIQGPVGTTDATGANFTYADNQWHHLVGVYDGTELRLYIDGSRVAAKTSSVGALRASGNALRMAEGWSGPFNGSIDAVRVYNNGLSDAQVAAVFQADGGGPAVPTNTVAATSTPPPGATVTASATSTATATPISAASTSTPTLSPTDTPMPTPTQSGGVSGPAGYWPLDENGGTVAHDQSGNGNDGAISGCAWTAGVVGSALACNGGHVVVPNSPSLSPTGAVSVALWIKTSVAQRGIGLVTKGPAGSDYDYMLYLGSTGVSFFIRDTVGTTDATGAIFTYADNQWHHLVGVYDGTQLRLYIDGSRVAARASSVGALRASGNALRMAEGWSGPFNGSIDAVRVYNNGLSDAQVAAVFQADGGATSTPRATVTKTPTLTGAPNAYCDSSETEQVFTIASGIDDDVEIQRTSTSAIEYPPVGLTEIVWNGIDFVTHRSFLTNFYVVHNVFLRWYISVPSGVTITSAYLVPFYDSNSGTHRCDDGLDMIVEWYSWTPPITSGDYAEAPPLPSSNNYAGHQHCGNEVPSDYFKLPLTHLDNLPASGASAYVGIRAMSDILPGDVPPTGLNYLHFHPIEDDGPAKFAICYQAEDANTPN